MTFPNELDTKKKYVFMVRFWNPTMTTLGGWDFENACLTREDAEACRAEFHARYPRIKTNILAVVIYERKVPDAT